MQRAVASFLSQSFLLLFQLSERHFPPWPTVRQTETAPSLHLGGIWEDGRGRLSVCAP